MSETVRFEIQCLRTNGLRAEWRLLEYGKPGDLIRGVITKTIEDARKELAKAQRRNKNSMYPSLDFRIVKKVITYEVVN